MTAAACTCCGVLRLLDAVEATTLDAVVIAVVWGIALRQTRHTFNINQKYIL